MSNLTDKHRHDCTRLLKDKILLYVERGKSKRLEVVFKCPTCAEDPELFGEGVFTILKSNLWKGIVSCGCSKTFKYSKSQYEVRVKRLCHTYNYSFLGWKGEFKKCRDSYPILKCETTNVTTSTTSLDSFLNAGTEIPKNFNLKTRKSEQEVLDNLKGNYPSTVELRFVGDRLVSDGICWEYYCNLCETLRSMRLTSIHKGITGCGCYSKVHSDEDEGYLYVVEWYGFCESFIKFGYTMKSVEDRVKEQFYKGKLDYNILYKIKGKKKNIVQIEYLLKNKYKNFSKCPRDWLPDGYTETVQRSELSNILLTLNNLKISDIPFKFKETLVTT